MLCIKRIRDFVCTGIKFKKFNELYDYVCVYVLELLVLMYNIERERGKEAALNSNIIICFHRWWWRFLLFRYDVFVCVCSSVSSLKCSLSLVFFSALFSRHLLGVSSFLLSF